MPSITLKNFRLGSGALLPEVEIAYTTYGKMAADRSNVILVTHGTTSSHLAAGIVTPDRRKGWWDSVIGPGRLFDSERFCILSSNVLGSCYGSTAPASVNPATGRPYGPDFPAITLEDIVTAQYGLLQALGVEHLVAVAGSSIGGFQALQWAVSFPDAMNGVIALDTATRSLDDGSASLAGLRGDLAREPAWQGGHHYAEGGMEAAMTAIRLETLISYGIQHHIASDPGNQPDERTLEQTAAAWAREFDANSLLLLQQAFSRFDIEDRLSMIRVPLLYVMADSDQWFPAEIGRAVLQRLRQAGVRVTYQEIISRHGHYATTMEPEKWVPAARAFLNRIAGSP